MYGWVRVGSSGWVVEAGGEWQLIFGTFWQYFGDFGIIGTRWGNVICIGFMLEVLVERSTKSMFSPPWNQVELRVSSSLEIHRSRLITINCCTYSIFFVTVYYTYHTNDGGKKIVVCR